MNQSILPNSACLTSGQIDADQLHAGVLLAIVLVLVIIITTWIVNAIAAYRRGREQDRTDEALFLLQLAVLGNDVFGARLIDLTNCPVALKSMTP